MAGESVGLSLDGGTFQKIPPNATPEEQIVVLNDVIERLNGLLQSQTLADGANKRFILGYSIGRWPGGDFGIAISRPGTDVISSEFNDLLFAWDFSTGTQYWWNPETGIQYRQDGKLPDSDYGFFVASEGNSVEEAFE